jgi:ABC-type multidrug transport system ATPase subunit
LLPPETGYLWQDIGAHAGVHSEEPGEKSEPVDAQAAVIVTDRLTKRFGEQSAVSEATFSIPPGLIFGYVGPSGSGKTTTIKLLLGLLRPTEGQVSVLGLPPESFDKKTRKNIGYMPQSFALYPGLTVGLMLLAWVFVRRQLSRA